LSADRRPELSVILPADVFDTIRDVVRCLAEQSARDLLELVVVSPSAAALGLPEEVRKSFGAVQVVEVGEMGFAELYRARVAGVAAATAPVVVFAETHSFPEPGWAEALIEAHRGPWVGVGPVLLNANPESAVSWSNLLMDYGDWVGAGSPGPRPHVPGHNGAFKRDALLAYGPALADVLHPDTRLTDDLRARGHAMYFEPAARTRHLNVTRPGSWLVERLDAGREFAAGRAWEWPLWRRLAYAAGSPLIPLVRLRRIAGDIRRIGSAPGLGPRILPALLVGLGVSAAGELVGYLFGPSRGAARRLAEIELHRARHVRSKR
jgi:hypothetical protein